MLLKKTCCQCGNEFTTEYPSKVYCSNPCQKASKAMRRVNTPVSRDIETAVPARKKLATLDFETDPFYIHDGKAGEIAPFAYGLMLESGEYFSKWDSECGNVNGLLDNLLDNLFSVIDSLDDDYIIYAHNGGRFDFLFMIEHLALNVKSESEDKRGYFLIGSRLTRFAYKRHDFRDSYSILPVPLSSGNAKLAIDYAKMEKSQRNKYRDEIDVYLKQDCKALMDMVTKYRDVFGKSNGDMPLTMAGAAFKELKKFTSQQITDKTPVDQRPINGKGKVKNCPAFTPLGTNMDKILRGFYAGGHTQDFIGGIIHAPSDKCVIEVYDVVSEYPAVMSEIEHPVGGEWFEKTVITPDTWFIEFEGVNRGGVWSKSSNGSIDFTAETGVFKTTIHEYNMAIKYDLITVTRIISTWNCCEKTTFASFVKEFFDRRKIADANNDDVLTLFWKLVLNSSYGKFGQNPDNFKNYHIVERNSEEHKTLMWDVKLSPKTTLFPSMINGRELCIVGHDLSEDEKTKQMQYNVATAASITGAARALLMDGIYKSADSGCTVLYCDTDSLFTVGQPCKLDVVEEKILGKWQHEESGDCMAIAGKKSYALFRGTAESVLNNPVVIDDYNKFKYSKETLRDYLVRIKKGVKGYKLGYSSIKGFAFIPFPDGKVKEMVCVKTATKGNRINPQQIVNIAYDVNHNELFVNPVPSINKVGQQTGVNRIARNTGHCDFAIGKYSPKVIKLVGNIKDIDCDFNQ